MEFWFLAIFLPLGIWVWVHNRRIDGLARRVAELELQLFSLRDAAAAPPAETFAASPTELEEEPLLLTEVVPDDVLVLDNPLPEVSNDTEASPPPAPPPASAEKPRMHSPLLLDETAAAPAPPRAEPERAAEPPKVRKPSGRLDQWLAEKGLAWLAGVALAVGAIYLVAVAVQSGWLTPPLRIAAALLLAVVILGVSEWTRRLGVAKPPGHPLMSALLAGVGMIVLYATVWGALGFGFINGLTATALLTLCAMALIGLSFLHGEALGVLAIIMALLAPALTNAPMWPSWLLTIYVGGVSAGAFALAAFRRWAWVAAATLAGLYFWFFEALSAEDLRRALAAIAFASLGGVCAALRLPIENEAKAPLPWSTVRAYGASVAVSVSSVLLIWAWLIAALSPVDTVMGAAIISVLHVALAAYAVRQRIAMPLALAITIGALVLGFVTYLRWHFPQPLASTFYPALLASAFTVIALTVFARPHRSGRLLATAAGAIGAAFLIALSAASRGEGWHSPVAWVALFSSAALLFVAGWRREGDTAERKTDRALDFWGGSAAVLLLLGLESALGPEVRTAGHAAAVLLFSIGLTWRGWRIFGWAALAAAAISLGHALSPALIGATLAGQLPLWAGLLILLGAATLLFSASTVIRRSGENIGIAEALSAAAVIAALVAVFVALRWIAAGGAGVTLDAFTEISLHVLALMAAGLTLLPRVHETPGPIGAWRGHVLLGLGLAYALLIPGLAINPWWGAPGRAVVNGLPLLNGLAPAFLAPAALAFVTANRLYTRQLVFARIYAAVGAALTLLWLVMEIRHAFHNPAMAEPLIGLFESACYALAALAFALVTAVAARMRAARNPHRPFTQDLTHVMRGVAWGALGFAVLIMLLAKHPIWGAQDSTTSNALSTLLAVLAQIVALLLALALGRALSVSKEAEPTRFATASAAVLFAWSAGHCAIRWFYHAGYMDDRAREPLGLEGILHAVWPLALVIGAAQLTRAAPGRDTVRAYLYDLQAIWAASIWPALAFAGLGLWLLFNPWWGIEPSEADNILAAGAALALILLAAALSYVSPDVPHVRWVKWLVPTATALCAAHLFVAATLIVRWLWHGDAMSGALAGQLELWIYSAVWALFGAAALGLGTARNDPVLRWIGLVVFFATIVKVFVVDTARLSGVIRAASFLGLGAIAAVATWMARRNRPPPSPGDLVTVTPSARRERRRVRRRTSP